MRSLWIFFFQVCILPGFAQKSKPEASLTAGHIPVPGTRVSMVLPGSFVKAVNFSGFQDEPSGSSIMVIPIPAPFEDVSKSMNAEGFASQGISVENTEILTVSGLPGIFVSGSQKAYGIDYTKYSLIFGHEEETVVINGACPADNRQVAKKMKTAMLSVVYSPDLEIDPLASVDFELKEGTGHLQFARSVANSLIYTADGELPPQKEDKTTLIVAKSFSELSIEQHKEFALQRLKHLPLKIERIISTDSTSVDRLPGYEIVADGSDPQTASRERILLNIVYGDTFYYLFVGTTNVDYERNLARIREMIGSFRRKENPARE